MAKVVGLVEAIPAEAELDALVEDLKRFDRVRCKAGATRSKRLPPPSYLPLGAPVNFRAVANPIYHGNYRVLDRIPLDEPKAGIVVGVRTLQEGEQSGASGGGWDGDYEPASFVPMRTQRVYLVAFSLYTKPVYALLDDVEPATAKEATP